jgi:hypothetical protein
LIANAERQNKNDTQEKISRHRGSEKGKYMLTLTIIAGGLGFGFAILAIVLVIVSFIKGKHALSGQVVPLQQIHEIFNPGQQNIIEILEEKQTQQDESGNDK